MWIMKAKLHNQNVDSESNLSKTLDAIIIKRWYINETCTPNFLNFKTWLSCSLEFFNFTFN
jgi:hypothetical protein